jgi:hypothetical protein
MSEDLPSLKQKFNGDARQNPVATYEKDAQAKLAGLRESQVAQSMLEHLAQRCELLRIDRIAIDARIHLAMGDKQAVEWNLGELQTLPKNGELGAKAQTRIGEIRGLMSMPLVKEVKITTPSPTEGKEAKLQVRFEIPGNEEISQAEAGSLVSHGEIKAQVYDAITGQWQDAQIKDVKIGSIHLTLSFTAQANARYTKVRIVVGQAAQEQALEAAIVVEEDFIKPLRGAVEHESTVELYERNFAQAEPMVRRVAAQVLIAIAGKIDKGRQGLPYDAADLKRLEDAKGQLTALPAQAEKLAEYLRILMHALTSQIANVNEKLAQKVVPPSAPAPAKTISRLHGKIFNQRENLVAFYRGLGKRDAARQPQNGREAKAQVFLNRDGWPAPFIGKFYTVVAEGDIERLTEIPPEELKQKHGITPLLDEAGRPIEIIVEIPQDTGREIWIDGQFSLVISQDGAVKAVYFGWLAHEEVAKRIALQPGDTLEWAAKLSAKGIGSADLTGHGDFYSIRRFDNFAALEQDLERFAWDAPTRQQILERLQQAPVTAQPNLVLAFKAKNGPVTLNFKIFKKLEKGKVVFEVIELLGERAIFFVNQVYKFEAEIFHAALKTLVPDAQARELAWQALQKGYPITYIFGQSSRDWRVSVRRKKADEFTVCEKKIVQAVKGKSGAVLGNGRQYTHQPFTYEPRGLVSVEDGFAKQNALLAAGAEVHSINVLAVPLLEIMGPVYPEKWGVVYRLVLTDAQGKAEERRLGFVEEAIKGERPVYLPAGMNLAQATGRLGRNARKYLAIGVVLLPGDYQAGKDEFVTGQDTDFSEKGGLENWQGLNGETGSEFAEFNDADLGKVNHIWHKVRTVDGLYRAAETNSHKFGPGLISDRGLQS